MLICDSVGKVLVLDVGVCSELVPGALKARECNAFQKMEAIPFACQFCYCHHCVIAVSSHGSRAKHGSRTPVLPQIAQQSEKNKTTCQRNRRE